VVVGYGRASEEWLGRGGGLRGLAWIYAFPGLAPALVHRFPRTLGFLFGW
jgi:hypothetical protein